MQASFEEGDFATWDHLVTVGELASLEMLQGIFLVKKLMYVHGF